MTSEIEVKYLCVDIDDVRTRLKSIGAHCEQPMRLMRRVTIENEHMQPKNAFVRVRDEGHRVVMTYKQFDALSIDGAQEIEIEVNDFEAAAALVRAMGYVRSSFQESKRETWRIGNVEIVIDEWPWLKPYIEIEGPDVESIKSVAEKLGFAWSDAVFGDVMVAYRAQYPHLKENQTVGGLESVRFSDPLPQSFLLH